MQFVVKGLKLLFPEPLLRVTGYFVTLQEVVAVPTYNRFTIILFELVAWLHLVWKARHDYDMIFCLHEKF